MQNYSKRRVVWRSRKRSHCSRSKDDINLKIFQIVGFQGRQSCSSIPFRAQIGELILNNTVQWRYHKENGARHLAVLRVSVSETLVIIRLLPNPFGNTVRTSGPEYSSLIACSCSVLRLWSNKLSFSIKKSIWNIISVNFISTAVASLRFRFLHTARRLE